MKTGRTDFGLFLLPQFLALLCSSYLGYHRDDHDFDWNDHDFVFTHNNDHDDHNHDDGWSKAGLVSSNEIDLGRISSDLHSRGSSLLFVWNTNNIENIEIFSNIYLELSTIFPHLPQVWLNHNVLVRWHRVQIYEQGIFKHGRVLQQQGWSRVAQKLEWATCGLNIQLRFTSSEYPDFSLHKSPELLLHPPPLLQLGRWYVSGIAAVEGSLGKSNAFSQSYLCSISSMFWATRLCVLGTLSF